MANLDITKIFIFEDSLEAERHLARYENDFGQAHHYTASVDRAYIFIKEEGTPHRQDAAGIRDDQKLVHLVISSPIPIQKN